MQHRGVNLSKNVWLILGIVAIFVLGGAIYLVLTKDSRADARMERQIGPLPEK